MTVRPPFERYPGPPPGSGDVYRVISPYRDALAWVSSAGRLSLVRFLVREGEGWRTIVEVPEDLDTDGGTRWVFAHRDPVEVVLETDPATGIAATASVTVSRDGCEVRIQPALSHRERDDLVAGAGTWFHIRGD